MVFANANLDQGLAEPHAKSHFLLRHALGLGDITFLPRPIGALPGKQVGVSIRSGSAFLWSSRQTA